MRDATRKAAKPVVIKAEQNTQKSYEVLPGAPVNTVSNMIEVLHQLLAETAMYTLSLEAVLSPVLTRPIDIGDAKIKAETVDRWMMESAGESVLVEQLRTIGFSILTQNQKLADMFSRQQLGDIQGKEE